MRGQMRSDFDPAHWFAPSFFKRDRVCCDDGGNRIKPEGQTQAHRLPWHKKGDEPEVRFWLGTYYRLGKCADIESQQGATNKDV
jgi:hypothetical protein